MRRQQQPDALPDRDPLLQKRPRAREGGGINSPALDYSSRKIMVAAHAMKL
jgi:hypothetical protein